MNTAKEHDDLQPILAVDVGVNEGQVCFCLCQDCGKSYYSYSDIAGDPVLYRPAFPVQGAHNISDEPLPTALRRQP